MHTEDRPADGTSAGCSDGAVERGAYARAILDSVQAGIILVDPVTRIIVDANPVAAAIVGLPAGEIVGQVCHQFVCPAALNQCPICDLGQTVDNAERIVLTEDGTAVPVVKTVVPVVLDGRRLLLECFVDISDRKRTEAELRRAEAESAEMRAVVATTRLLTDRINNPMMVIFANCERLVEGGASLTPDSVAAIGERILAAATQASQVVHSLERIVRPVVDEIPGVGEVLNLQQSLAAVAADGG